MVTLVVSLEVLAQSEGHIASLTLEVVDVGVHSEVLLEVGRTRVAFAAVGAVVVVLALVLGLMVPLEVAFCAEHFVALGAGEAGVRLEWERQVLQSRSSGYKPFEF